MPLSSEQERQKLKQKYGSFYEALVELLAEDDPMNIVRVGAPRDEYDLEVSTILSRLNEADSPATLGRIIYETFVAWFGPTFAPPDEPPSEARKLRFEALGERAWAAWRKWQEEAQQK